jgi:C-terminal processing protease CtpA/Prc
VTQSYIDPSFNHQPWDAALSAALADSAAAGSPEVAAEEIGEMLGSLGDPYTRWLPPREYADFRVGSDGELQGVGLLIASDPASGRLLVLAPISGSPAERAGIMPGDEVLSVDGRPTAGWSGDVAATYLRGRHGSHVWVEVARKASASAPAPGEQIPGLAGQRRDVDEQVQLKRFRLTRERLELSPVFGTALHADDHTFGYLRLVNFSARAADDLRSAVAQLQRDGAEAFILDLRNNPGGLVNASVDVAGLWMDGARHPTVFQIEASAGVYASGLGGWTARGTRPSSRSRRVPGSMHRV